MHRLDVDLRMQCLIEWPRAASESVSAIMTAVGGQPCHRRVVQSNASGTGFHLNYNELT